MSIRSLVTIEGATTLNYYNPIQAEYQTIAISLQPQRWRVVFWLFQIDIPPRRVEDAQRRTGLAAWKEGRLKWSWLCVWGSFD